MTLTTTHDVMAILRSGQKKHSAGDLDGALAAYLTAMRADPEHPDVMGLIASLCRDMRRPDLAVECFQESIRLRPDHAPTRVNYASTLMQRGEVVKNVAELRRALLIDPQARIAHENLVFALDHDHGATFEERLGARHTYRRLIHDPIRERTGPPEGTRFDWPCSRDAARKLRVGYVSGDFRSHSMATHLAPMLEHHDRERYEIHLFSSRDTIPDPRWYDLSDRYHHLPPGDDDAAALVLGEGIDILVDCSQYTSGNRLTLFAQRPAPVQVTGWGFISDTTGLDCFDAIATHPAMVHLRQRQHYSEPELLFLPSPLLYSAGPFPVRLTPTPYGQNKYITFGYLGRACKINEDVIRAWAQVLLNVPASRLLLKCPSFDDPLSAALVVDALVARGIADERIEVRSRTPWDDHVRAWGEVDIALDAWPQNGGVTTIEAMMAGAPTICQGGFRPGDRLGAVLNKSAGIPWHPRQPHSTLDFVSQALDAVKAVVADAEGVRRRVHEAAMAAPFSRPEEFTRALEQEYRRLWLRWTSEHP